MFFKKVFIFICTVCIAGELNCVAFSQQKVQDFYLSNLQQDGSKSWEMKGKEARVFDTHVEINNMNARYYHQDKVVDIRADKGKLLKPRMYTYLQDNVEIKSNDGAALFTDSITWDRDKDLIESGDKVTLEQGGLKVEAEGFEANTELEKVDFQKNVKVDVPRDRPGNMVTIQCEGPLEVDFIGGYAVFNNNVNVDSQEGKMIADKATVYFDRTYRTIIKIISEGRVKLIRDDNVTFAEKAIYLEKEKKLILEGNPRLIFFPKYADTGN